MKKWLSTLLIVAIGFTYVSSAAAQDIGSGSAQQGTTITIPSIKIVRTTGGSVSFDSNDISASAFGDDGVFTTTKSDVTSLVTIHNYENTNQKVTVQWANDAPDGFGTSAGNHQLAVRADDNAFATVASGSASDVVSGIAAGASTFSIDYQLTVDAQAGQVSNATNDLTFTMTADN